MYLLFIYEKKRYILILFFNGSPTIMACHMLDAFVLVQRWNGDVYFCPLPLLGTGCVVIYI